ncbi:coenzyme F420 hydrogenase domain protein [Enterococcus faecalis 13-SD-W-01]|nr:coenzyme F420 hydrogenase domain protein [Enterococcus faecalis 13-SD-W-01]
MFTSEEGAYPIINEAVDKYEKHFKQSFPLYEYIYVTKDKNYDFSISGAKKLSKLINGRIQSNKAVDVPPDYNERLY